MTEDKIAEIRDRHSKRTQIDHNGSYRLDGYSYPGTLTQSQRDLETALAEVDRQRADNERLRADRRERIATAAMQGMLASAELVAPPVHAGFIAKWAVVYADALIAKLDEEGKP